jgi:hypothetical protein
LTLLLGVLSLAVVGCGGGSGVSTTTGIVSAPIKETVEAYFIGCFDSEKTLSYSKMSSGIVADNENVQLSEAFQESDLARKKVFGENIAVYQYKINYQKCSVSGKTATIELTLDLNFHYQDAPSDLNSALGGVDYSLTLENNGTNWVITRIDSDLAEFEVFKNLVQEALRQNTALSKTAAIEQVGDSIKQKLELIKNNSLYLKGNPAATTTPSSDTSTTEAAGSSGINKFVYVSGKKYTYDASCAVAYAAAYYNAETTRESPFLHSFGRLH